MKDYNIVTFGENVRYLVERMGEDISEFEDRIGMSRGYISRITRGTLEPRMITVIRIADALEMYVDDIFFYDKSSDMLEDLQNEREALKNRLAEINEGIEDLEERLNK